MRLANRAAVRKAIGVCVEGRDPAAAAALVERRDTLDEPVLQRRLMPITSIETRVYRYPLDPPFRAAWDPVPRTHQDATVVLVHTDDGVTGVASGGDGLPDRELLERLLVGVDVRETDAVGGDLRDGRLPRRRGRGRSRSPSGTRSASCVGAPVSSLLGGAQRAACARTPRPARR